MTTIPALQKILKGTQHRERGEGERGGGKKEEQEEEEVEKEEEVLENCWKCISPNEPSVL